MGEGGRLSPVLFSRVYPHRHLSRHPHSFFLRYKIIVAESERSDQCVVPLAPLQTCLANRLFPGRSPPSSFVHLRQTKEPKTMSDAELPVWWQPTEERVATSNLNRFRKALNATYGTRLETYDDIHRFSVERLEDFWKAMWEWGGIRATRKPSRVLAVKEPASARPGDLPRFFDDALVNLAENM